MAGNSSEREINDMKTKGTSQNKTSSQWIENGIINSKCVITSRSVQYTKSDHQKVYQKMDARSETQPRSEFLIGLVPHVGHRSQSQVFELNFKDSPPFYDTLLNWYGNI